MRDFDLCDFCCVRDFFITLNFSLELLRARFLFFLAIAIFIFVCLVINQFRICPAIVLNQDPDIR